MLHIPICVHDWRYAGGDAQCRLCGRLIQNPSYPLPTHGRLTNPKVYRTFRRVPATCPSGRRCSWCYTSYRKNYIERIRYYDQMTDEGFDVPRGGFGKHDIC